jgi:hypothetical protein
MNLQRSAISALFAAALAALPLSAAKAQYYYPCNPFPLTWPFCIAGAAVGTAAAIATAPFYAVAGSPYYYYYGQPYYYASGYYYPVRRHYRRHHHRYYY